MCLCICFSFCWAGPSTLSAGKPPAVPAPRLAPLPAYGSPGRKHWHPVSVRVLLLLSPCPVSTRCGCSVSMFLEFSRTENITFGGMTENMHISVFSCWYCLCHPTWHFFFQSWCYWNPANSSKCSSNAVFLVRHSLTSQPGVCNLLAPFLSNTTPFCIVYIDSPKNKWDIEVLFLQLHKKIYIVK